MPLESPNKGPSQHERRSPEVECCIDHCFQERVRLQDAAQKAFNARNRLQAENETLRATVAGLRTSTQLEIETLRAIVAKLEQSIHNTVPVPFTEI